jgi:hypothetical protein
MEVGSGPVWAREKRVRLSCRNFRPDGLSKWLRPPQARRYPCRPAAGAVERAAARNAGAVRRGRRSAWEAGSPTGQASTRHGPTRESQQARRRNAIARSAQESLPGKSDHEEQARRQDRDQQIQGRERRARFARRQRRDDRRPTARGSASAHAAVFEPATPEPLAGRGHRPRCRRCPCPPPPRW